MSPTLRIALFVVTCGAALACGRNGETTSSPTSPTSAVASNAAAPASTQLDVGAKYFARDCAACHGNEGQGTATGPRVIGTGALPEDPPNGAMQRKIHFVTAGDVYRFVSTHMPNDVIGQMPESYSYDVTAFMLSRNGVALPPTLDATNAAQVALRPSSP